MAEQAGEDNLFLFGLTAEQVAGQRSRHREGKIARSLVKRMAAVKITITLPEFWRLVQHANTDVAPLDAFHAQAVGLLLARSGTSDIADAHVMPARRRSWNPGVGNGVQ